MFASLSLFSFYRMLNHLLCKLFVVLMLCVTHVNHHIYSLHVVCVLKYHMHSWESLVSPHFKCEVTFLKIAQ